MAQVFLGHFLSVIDCSRIGAIGVERGNPFLILVGRARFELATNGLKVRCSTG